MTTLFVTLALSFAICLILTPIARALAVRCNLVDRPDGHRKTHARPIPVAGGIAVFLSTTAALTVAWLLSPLHHRLSERGPGLLGLFLSALVLCAVGVADDKWCLRGRHKLLGQIVAVGILIYSGLLVENIHLFGWHIELGLLAIPFTAFWMLGAINSLNLLDGMDGLLACVGVIITSAVVLMCVLGGHWATALVAIALVGGLLGFLVYNFPPASIFLGDAGSMLIGLVVGVLAIQSALKGPATVALAAPLALLTIPILDSGAAIVRRKLTGRSIYTTDRGHLHHCLSRRGLSNRGVLFWVSFFCLLTVAGALASLMFHHEIYALVTFTAVASILVVTRLFGYAEFLLLKEQFVGLAASFLNKDAARANGRQSQVRLQGSADWKQVWTTVVECTTPLNLHMVRLDVNAPALYEGYHARWDRLDGQPREANLWRAELPVVKNGQIVGRLEVSGERDEQPVWMKIAAMAKLVDNLEAGSLPQAATPVETPALTSAATPRETPAVDAEFRARALKAQQS